MNIKTWNDLINDENINYIYLIWYWSLINKKTWHKSTKFYWLVEATWFKRIFNLYIPENIRNKIEERNREIIWNNYEKKYNVNWKCSWKNVWALNCEYTWDENDKINWVLLKIDRDALNDMQKEKNIIIYMKQILTLLIEIHEKKILMKT